MVCFESESESCSVVWVPLTIQSMEFSRPEHLSGQPFPSPGDLPNAGIKPRSPALQADSLLTELQGKEWEIQDNLIYFNCPNLAHGAVRRFSFFNIYFLFGCTGS